MVFIPCLSKLGFPRELLPLANWSFPVSLNEERSN